AFLLDDAARARLLYDALLPYADRHPTICGPFASYGSLERNLGLLAATLEDVRAAEGHFKRAVEVNRGAGARAFEAEALCDHSRVLSAVPGREPDALRLLEQAASLAGELGLDGVAARAAGVRDALTPEPQSRGRAGLSSWFSHVGHRA